ncbi:hypothetical protein GCM10020367_40110 [Streptomyces sannanensis]|uniref:DUF4034 domain-containing protein n=1 Tax=Streptomyces sannanensis TaxID=285536 RepID=A0ABP6SEL0_9ACTN
MLHDIFTGLGLIGLLWAIAYVFVLARRNFRAKAGIDAAAYGLVPRAELDATRAGPVPAADEALGRAVAAAWRGEWEPAADLLAVSGEQEQRWDRLQELAHTAVDDERWLRTWRAVRPQDADAVAVQAQALLYRAWRARGSEYANRTSDEQAAAFHELLGAARYTAEEAARMAPRDPAPWITLVTAARGLNLSREEFQWMWGELIARAPYHYEAHWQALQFWCQKWHGSHKLMFGFADEAVEKAPAGSPLAAMYVYALYEMWLQSGDQAAYRAAGVKPRLRKVLASLEQVPAADPRLPRIRHLLAAALVKSGLNDAALEQFRLIGGWCGAAPWTDAKDPAAEFDRWRGMAALSARKARRAR